jgi:hypothetical protein
MAGNVNKTDLHIAHIHMGKTQVNGNASRLLFFKPVRFCSCQRAYKRTLAVIYVSRGTCYYMSHSSAFTFLTNHHNGQFLTSAARAEAYDFPEKEPAKLSRHEESRDGGGVSQPPERPGAPGPVIKQYIFVYLIQNAVYNQEQHNNVVKPPEAGYEIRNYVKRGNQIDSQSKKRRADAQWNTMVAKQLWNHQSDAGKRQKRFLNPALFYEINQKTGNFWNHILFSGR